MGVLDFLLLRLSRGYPPGPSLPLPRRGFFAARGGKGSGTGGCPRFFCALGSVIPVVGVWDLLPIFREAWRFLRSWRRPPFAGEEASARGVGRGLAVRGPSSPRGRFGRGRKA